MTTALIVIDMQHTLCTGADAGVGVADILARINLLGHRAREAGMPVVLVQHEEADSPFAHGSEGWALAAGLVTAATDLRVRKRSPNAFHATDLHRLLQERAVTRVVICGQQTEFCVDTTVRQALPLGYDVVLAEDAHTTTDGVLRAAQAIAHHNRTLRYLSGYNARIEAMPAANVSFEG